MQQSSLSSLYKNNEDVALETGGSPKEMKRDENVIKNPIEFENDYEDDFYENNEEREDQNTMSHQLQRQINDLNNAQDNE